MPDVDEVMAALRGYSYRFSDEVSLHDALNAVLVAADLRPRREVRLDSRSRIDFVVGRVGVEVKVKGATAAVRQQVLRYADVAALDAVLLVTTRPAHLLMDLPHPHRVLLLGSAR